MAVSHEEEGRGGETTGKLSSINAEEVREAIDLEHALSFRDAIALYPRAIGWSVYFSLGVIMLGKHTHLPHNRAAPSFLFHPCHPSILILKYP